MKLTEEAFCNYRQMAAEVEEEELSELLRKMPKIHVIPHAPNEDTGDDDDSLDCLIYETERDWSGTIEPISFHANLMSEAYYSIANNYFLSGYLTWPWYRHNSTSSLKEPYTPYFELWRRGARCCFEAEDRISVYCTALAD